MVTFKRYEDLFPSQPVNGVVKYPRLTKKESDELHHYLTSLFKDFQNDNKELYLKSEYCSKQGLSYFIPTHNGEVQLLIGKRKYEKSN